MSEPECPLTPGQHCPEIESIKRIENDLNDLRRQNSASHERIFDRLGKLEMGAAVRDEQYRHILDRLDTISTDVSSIDAKVDDVESRPGKRWDDLVKIALTAIVSGLIAYLLFMLGLSK